MTPRRKILIAVAVLAVAAGWYLLAERRPPAAAELSAEVASRLTAKAERRDIESCVVVSGFVRPVVTSEIKAEVSGKVAKLAVVIGQPVKKDDLLVELDPTLAKADYDEAARNLQLQRLNIEKLARDRARAEALRAKEFVSAKELEDAVTAHEVGKVQLEVIQARLDKAQENLRKTVIRAPHAGIVTDVGILEGQVVISAQSVNSGTLLMKVSDTDPLRVDVNLNEFDAVRVTLDRVADLTFDSLPGVRRPGKVTFIAPFGTSDSKDKEVRVFPCQISFESGFGVRPGISANASILVDKVAGCVAIPVSAIFIEDADRFVYVRKGDQWERRVVKLGLSDSNWTQVSEGVAEGDVLSLVRPAGKR